MGELKAGLLFQYDRIVDTVMDFGNGVSLKIVVDLGFKDQNGYKKRIYEEFKYPSSKYKNENSLITAKRNFNYYLRLDYPSSDSAYKYKNIIIPTFAILGLRDKIKIFDEILFDPYILKENKLDIIPSKIKTVCSHPMKNSVIEFSQSLYEGRDKDDIDYGVNIGLNNEFYFTTRSITKWKEFVYQIMTCDLYLWASQLVTPYITHLITNSISDSFSSSTKRYNIESTYESEIAENDINIINQKPLTRNEKIKSFFDD